MEHLFNLGDIVALKSHPYTSELQNILISGEPQLVSPLMIIVEIIKDSQDVFDEFTGVNLQLKGKTANCKCIWYSSKSSQFEEAWLSSKLLKLVKRRDKTIAKSDVIDSIVTLSTAQMELAKVKSSLNIENENKRTNLNPLLSFVSPLMQVIGIPKNDKKEALYDVKTGNKKKEISGQLVKCKWFNPSSDKMSEALIPMEALCLIPSISEAMLNEYATFAKEKQHLTITIEGSSYQTIFLPQKIKCSHGIYFIAGYDYIKNRICEFEISKLSNIKLESAFVKQAPNFKDSELKVLTLREQNKRLITDGLQGKKYLRIRYKDKHNNLTLRTLKNYSTEIITTTGINFEEQFTEYLNGFCQLRKDERHFQIERIQSVEILNINYE